MKQIQQVIKLKFLTLYNVIELTYDCNIGRGCKTKGHGHHQFDKLHIVSCEKTLNCQYFKELFLNISLNEDLDVLEKQQYYISFCHKVCEECLKTLHLECPNHITCHVREAKQYINYVTQTRWIF
jgi:hypothetical protein